MTFSIYILHSESSDRYNGAEKKSDSMLVCAWDRYNRLWWGTDDGVTRLDLNKFQLPKQAPRIRLRDIEVN